MQDELTFPESGSYKSASISERDGKAAVLLEGWSDEVAVWVPIGDFLGIAKFVQEWLDEQKPRISNGALDVCPICNRKP